MATSDLLQNHITKGKSKPKGLELDLDKLKSSQDFEKTFYELFRYSFITNCHLDEASVTGEELETLEELSTEEVLENFRDLVNDLLNFKKEFKSTDKAELAQRTEQFENMLQKLEAEVRNHIRVEHQLKLHIESNQNKIEDLERFKTEAQEKLSLYEDGKSTGGSKGEKNLQKVEAECLKLKLLLEDKVLECEKLKKELENKGKKQEKSSSSIDYLKKRMEEKVSELSKIQKIMREKNDKVPVKVQGRCKKKSLDENSRNTPSPFRGGGKEVEGSWNDSRPSTAKKTPSRSHVRSNSDQTRPLTKKKII